MTAKDIKEIINILEENQRTAERDSKTTDNDHIEAYTKGKVVAYEQALFFLNLWYRRAAKNENDEQ